MDIKNWKHVEIITLFKHTNKSQTEIAQAVGMNQSTCSRVIKQYQQYGDCMTNYQNCGGSNKKFNKRDLRHLRSLVVKSPRCTAANIRAELGVFGGVSIRTIQRALVEAGCKVVTSKKKSFISAANVIKHYNWARDHIKWTQSQWNNVVWSDETIVEAKDRCPRLVRVVQGHSITTDHYESTVKHPTKVMFWSCFSFKGTCRIHVMDGNHNSNGYIEQIINGQLKQQLQEWFPEGNGVFQQDNAPCHVSKKSLACFRDQGISLLEWPPSSPDLNPIENLWAIIKCRLRKINAWTKDDIIHNFTDVWMNDPEIPKVCQNLVLSMPKRVKAVFEAKGHHSRY